MLYVVCEELPCFSNLGAGFLLAKTFGLKVSVAKRTEAQVLKDSAFGVDTFKTSVPHCGRGCLSGTALDADERVRPGSMLVSALWWHTQAVVAFGVVGTILLRGTQ